MLKKNHVLEMKVGNMKLTKVFNKFYEKKKTLKTRGKPG